MENQRPDPKARHELLLKMYDQAWNNINRHVTIVWQSISVLVAAFALYAATGQRVISLDLASTILVVLTGWMMANVYDASSWYNRNQAIIANIEQEFMFEEDRSRIHPFFGSHREPGAVLRHLRVHLYMGAIIWLSIITYHFTKSVLPSLKWTSPFDLAKALPYLTTIAVYAVVEHVKEKAREDQREFTAASPGRSKTPDPGPS